MGAKDQILRMKQHVASTKRQQQEATLNEHADTALKKAVVVDALEAESDPLDWLRDVCQNGCESGIVGGMIYYHDTNAFYLKFKEDIWDILDEDSKNTDGGSVMALLGQMPWAKDIGSHEQLMNYLAWYGYETAANQLMSALEAEQPGDDL